ncbi:MAG: M28 family peptidase, partial [Bacteroidota bacterium]
AQYIAAQLRGFGYTPINDGSYFQEVPLMKTAAPQEGKLTIDDMSFTQMADLLIMRGPAAAAEGKVVFANYGWVDEETDHNDYEKLNVKGKIVITRAGIPGDVSQSGIFKGIREKAAMAAAAGAVGIFEMYSLPFPWGSFKGYLGGERMGLDNGNPAANIPYGFVKVQDDFLDRLTAKKKGLDGSMSSSGMQIEKILSANVGGILEGSDPELKDEYMIMTAHFDHVGVGAQGGGAYTEQDSIFNGARDNAFGTISLLATARAFAEVHTRRSIIILAVTGEEMGLLGSQWYAEHPLVPLEETIFNFNTDGAGYDDKTGISLIGANRTGIDPQVAAAAEAFGKKVINDPAPEQGLFDRYDNVSFA